MTDNTTRVIRMSPIVFTDNIIIDMYSRSIISLKEEVWAHTTLKTPPLLIEVPVPRQEVIYTCGRGIHLASFYNFDI